MTISPVYLRRDKAAQHVRDTWGLPCSTRWLAKLAVVGGGPIYRKAGRTPIYAPRSNQFRTGLAMSRQFVRRAVARCIDAPATIA